MIYWAFNVMSETYSCCMTIFSHTIDLWIFFVSLSLYLALSCYFSISDALFLFFYHFQPLSITLSLIDPITLSLSLFLFFPYISLFSLFIFTSIFLFLSTPLSLSLSLSLYLFHSLYLFFSSSISISLSLSMSFPSFLLSLFSFFLYFFIWCLESIFTKVGHNQNLDLVCRWAQNYRVIAFSFIFSGILNILKIFYTFV